MKIFIFHALQNFEQEYLGLAVLFYRITKDTPNQTCYTKYWLCLQPTDTQPQI